MKKFVHIVLLACLTAACKREKPVSPEPLPSLPNYFWTDYIGTYDVYDTLNHTQWVMKIKHIYHSERNNGNEDSVLIENFANKFNIRDSWSPTFDRKTNKPGLFVKIYHPILDNYGYKWHLGGIGDDTNTGIAENVILNDSIILYFRKSNIAFYQADGVPYYDCYCKHIAVKRH